MIRKNNLTVHLFFATILVISLGSCDPARKYEDEESASKQDYIRSNSNLSFTQKNSGLYYMELVAGSGTSPVATDSVYIKYTGKLLNGLIFDSNVDVSDTVFYAVNRLISGFSEGLTYMRPGGKSIFLLPSFLAYGNSGYYMPAYTPLVFDVELLFVKPGIK